jgi:hypothetical protein
MLHSGNVKSSLEYKLLTRAYFYVREFTMRPELKFEDQRWSIYEKVKIVLLFQITMIRTSTACFCSVNFLYSAYRVYTPLDLEEDGNKILTREVLRT